MPASRMAWRSGGFLTSVLIAALAAGCSGVRRVPFEQSSLDFNDGQPFVGAVAGDSAQAAAERVAAAARGRGLTVEERRCESGRCLLRLSLPPRIVERGFDRTVTTTERGSYDPKSGRYVYASDQFLPGILIDGRSAASREPTRTKVVGHSTETVQIKFESVILARVIPHAGRFAVELIGVPRQNGALSCPKAAQSPDALCRPEIYAVARGDTPVSAAKRIWGMDISGKEEAALARGLQAAIENP